jgi:hypothetical protein
MARYYQLRPGIRAVSPFAPDYFEVDDDGRITAYRAGLAVMSFSSLEQGLDRYQLRRDDVDEASSPPHA